VRCYILLGLVWWLCACGAPAPSSQPNPNLPSSGGGSVVVSGPGQLLKWSHQTAVCDKKLLFIHGRFMTDTNPNGQSLATVERIFSSKLIQLDGVCKENLGKSLDEVVEVCFYTYNTHQPVDKIANDLAQLIQTNPAWRAAQICVVGYSEGGAVAWLLDQNYQLMQGGVLLGAPLLGSPLANRELVDKVARVVLPNCTVDVLHRVIDCLLGGSENLVFGHPGSRSAKSELMMFAGRIPVPASISFVPQIVDALTEMVDSSRYGEGPQTSNRQVAQVGAILINAADWQGVEPQDKQSDGVVPVSSAIFGSNGHFRIWNDYDHYDLLSGKDDLILDRATFAWVDHVLHLSPEFATSADVPALPEISLNLSNPLTASKFAYVKDQQICLVGQNWQNPQIVSATGASVYPRFSGDGTQLVWTQTVSGFSDIYLLAGAVGESLTCDGVSRYAEFSPDNDWLAYQSGDQLMIHNLKTGRRFVVVSGVDLVMPPLWLTVNQTLGHIYFVNRDAAGKTNLYWISPRQRNQQLSDAKLVTEGCQSIFLVRGSPVGGILALQTCPNKLKVSVVTNTWVGSLFLDVQPGDRPGIIPHGNTGLTLQLDQDYQLESASLELNDWQPQLYLVDKGDKPGIYLLNLYMYLSEDDPQFETIYQLVVPDASELDINPAAGP